LIQPFTYENEIITRALFASLFYSIANMCFGEIVLTIEDNTTLFLKMQVNLQKRIDIRFQFCYSIYAHVCKG